MARTDKIILKAQPGQAPSPKADLAKSTPDDQHLSRTDRFLITSMLLDDYPSSIKISDDTIIGGLAVDSVMELGRCELSGDMRPEHSFESMHVMYLLNVQKMACDCFKEVQRNTVDLPARDINLRYALMATETFIRLFDQLQSYWAKNKSMPSGERVLVPLTPNTLIDGSTLRQIMEWARVELYLNLKPKDPYESILADLVVRTHKAAWDCHEQADWKRHKPQFREINVKYALKGTESSARLFARLESYRAQHLRAGRTPKVVAAKVGRHSKQLDKARVNLNGNGKHL
jgi:hypothetical protein